MTDQIGRRPRLRDLRMLEVIANPRQDALRLSAELVRRDVAEVRVISVVRGHAGQYVIPSVSEGSRVRHSWLIANGG